jgi:hypothetical protein
MYFYNELVLCFLCGTNFFFFLAITAVVSVDTARRLYFQFAPTRQRASDVIVEAMQA